MNSPVFKTTRRAFDAMLGRTLDAPSAGDTPTTPDAPSTGDTPNTPDAPSAGEPPDLPSTPSSA